MMPVSEVRPIIWRPSWKRLTFPRQEEIWQQPAFGLKPWLLLGSPACQPPLQIWDLPSLHNHMSQVLKINQFHLSLSIDKEREIQIERQISISSVSLKKLTSIHIIIVWGTGFGGVRTSTYLYWGENSIHKHSRYKWMVCVTMRGQAFPLTLCTSHTPGLLSPSTTPFGQSLAIWSVPPAMRVGSNFSTSMACHLNSLNL